MPAKIPVSAAKKFAGEQGLRQVIIMAWDGERTHCVTYGKTIEDCAEAAAGGNELKKALGWPEKLMAEPSRVKKLKARIAQLSAALVNLIAVVPGSISGDLDYRKRYEEELKQARQAVIESGN